MLGIPVLCVQLVLTVDRSERYRLSAWARMLWLPSAVLLELVLTNDLHQQVFRLQQPWNEKYQYGWLFGLVVGWIVICILLAFGIIAHKSRNPRILRRLPLPAIPMVLLGQVAVLGVYLKRGANLMFLAQQHRYVPSAELRYALEESISSLELAGVECAMEVTHGVRLPAEAAAGPHAAASPRRVPQALRGFFCWRHGPFRQKKTGLLHISVGQSCLAARVGARASGVSGRVRLSARFSFPPEPPGCFPGSARASARC